jgi:predicted phage terminase large subunit-like protein
MRQDASLIAAVLRRDFYSFIQATFPLVSPSGMFLPNWHIEAMAFALTRVLHGEVKRLIITVPPRSLKSICASVAFPAFVLGHDPRRRIICVSYSESLAAVHSAHSRSLMRSSLYRRLFPHVRVSPEKDTQLEFATTRGGYRLAASVGGTLTGRGGNFVILDDPMKANDAYSESARDDVRQWFSNTLLTRLDNKAEDAIVLVMQRLHVDDLVGYLLQQGGWTHLNLPAIAAAEECIPLGPGRVHRRRAGDPLHPEREPLPVLESFKQAMGSLDFGAQYQQEPVAERGNLIKWDWFRFYDEPPGWQAGDKLIVSWDTAMSGKDLASYSVCVVCQVRGETVYVLDVVRERLEYPDLRRRVIALHRRWRNVGNNYSLLIENKGSGLSLIQDLRGEHIHAVPIDPEGDKVMRMTAQSARIEVGAVVLPGRAGWLDEFRSELVAFPAGRYTDQVDAFSQALHRAFNRGRGESAAGFAKGIY